MSADLHLHPLHARLVEVETALAFQQKLVDDLNATVQTQNQTLYQMEIRVRALQEQLINRQAAGSLRGKSSAAANVGENSAEEDMSE